MSQPADSERDQELLAQLAPDTARLLFPEKFSGPVVVTLVHPPLEDAVAEQARELAAEAAQATDPDGSQRLTFTLVQLDALYDTYSLLESSIDPATIQILINDKPLPMVRELWLPLFWSLRS